MSTKTDIQTQINTINDSGLNTADEVRKVFGTTTDSILENIYGDTVIDEVIGTLTITTQTNANILYKAVFQKVGRMITVEGFFQNITPNYLQNPVIFDITLPEYQNLSIGYSGLAYDNNQNNYDISLISSVLRFNNILAPGESLSYKITYNAEN